MQNAIYQFIVTIFVAAVAFYGAALIPEPTVQRLGRWIAGLLVIIALFRLLAALVPIGFFSL